MRGRFASLIALGAASLAMAPVAMPSDSGYTFFPQVQSKKSKRAVRRIRFADPRDYRSKNPPPKRKLKRNLVTHSRRVRRKHRRAA